MRQKSTTVQVKRDGHSTLGGIWFFFFFLKRHIGGYEDEEKRGQNIFR